MKAAPHLQLHGDFDQKPVFAGFKSLSEKGLF
jgi:hypothetical protein